MAAQFKVDVKGFSETVRRYAAASGKTIADAFKIQGRLLFGELIQRTPPLSGKAIKRVLTTQNKALSQDVESLSAHKVGKRRVAIDVRKVILGLKTMPSSVTQNTFKSQNRSRVDSGEINSWGKFQRCQGRDAYRVFIDKGGTVYGVDALMLQPNASISDMKAVHERNRISRGRVTSAGQSAEKVIGRWKWLDQLVTTEANANKFIARKQKSVGHAKGGWAKAFMDLGGRMSKRGWVGKFAGKSGDCTIKDPTPWNITIEGTNHSRWASGGDLERIIPQAMAGRDRAIKKDIERILKEKFK